MRRRLARRSQLVRARTRAKNEAQAVLMRRLIRPAGLRRSVRCRRAALAGRTGVAVVEERETLDGCLRQIEFLDREIAAVDRPIARAALDWPEIRRLMTVPGVNVIVASTFLAAIGDIRRFRSARQLVGYLGLDPRVRQSGAGPAKHGRISKQGSAPARHALVEASWSVVRQPGPLRAFYERVRARRGHQIAVVAAARKLACLFWCLLTREQDYAFGQPSLTRKKLRRLEITAGAPKHQGQRGIWAANQALRERRARPRPPGRARLRAARSRLASRRTEEAGRERDTGARISIGPRRAKPRGRPQAPDICSSLTSIARAQPRLSHRSPPPTTRT